MSILDKIEPFAFARVRRISNRCSGLFFSHEKNVEFMSEYQENLYKESDIRAAEAAQADRIAELESYIGKLVVQRDHWQDRCIEMSKQAAGVAVPEGLEDAKEQLAEVFHACFTYQRPSMDWKPALDAFCVKWLSASPQPAVAERVECCNAKCGWAGLKSDTCMLGAIGPLCPECREVTEPVMLNGLTEAETSATASVAGPVAIGVSLMFDNPRAALVSFDRAPSDGDLRELHALLGNKPAPLKVPSDEVLESLAGQTMCRPYAVTTEERRKFAELLLAEVQKGGE